GPPHAGDRARERAGHRERDPAEPRDATPDGGAAARLPRAPLARVALTGGRDSSAEELHEASLDLLVALLELLGIDLQELQIAELRPARRILHAWMPRVESLRV